MLLMIQKGIRDRKRNRVKANNRCMKDQDKKRE